ncbi:hypothetical protein B296_00055084 [Ensete ventricosum]|uniref:Uncharacterized protein n=1 Tax=Ensete ventricosum TaxID=4639 RepID=A0A426XL16_ENSVE|nr:hypothetical protein B296_00055084 [Ensete ventricosum]
MPILIDTGSTNNFMNNKVLARIMLQIKECNRFNVKVADGRVLNCGRKCLRVKLTLQGQEIVVDIYLLPLDDYKSLWSLSLEDKADLKRVSLIGP